MINDSYKNVLNNIKKLEAEKNMLPKGYIRKKETLRQKIEIKSMQTAKQFDRQIHGKYFHYRLINSGIRKNILQNIKFWYHL